MFGFLVDDDVVVEGLRADSAVEVAKFLLSDVDLDCAVFGLFSAGSDGLCLMLLILKKRRVSYVLHNFLLIFHDV